MQLTDAKKPGRPKSPEKNAAILTAASELFLDLGWQGTSMDDVAARAEVSKQTVYTHFKSKEDLFRACVSSKISLYQLDASYTGNLSLEDSLRSYGMHFLKLFNDPQVIRMFRLLIAHCMDFPKLVQDFHAAGPAKAEAALAEILHAGDPGRFSANAEDSACAFLSSLKAPFIMDLIMNLRQSISEEEMAAHVKISIRRFLNEV